MFIGNKSCIISLAVKEKFVETSKYDDNDCRVANFADIMKVATMFIKTTFKDLKKVKKNKKLRIKMQSVPLFPDITKIADFR